MKAKPFGLVVILVLVGWGSSRDAARADSDTPPPIQACYNPVSGLVRIVADNKTDCRKPELPIEWSIQGPVGATGAQGLVGPQGPIGATGLIGATGAAGPAGPQGPTGAPGVAGVQGSAGIQGPQGSAGANGLPGAAGPAGPAGPQGTQGPTGATGSKGDTGPMGLQGPKGDTGLTGAQGSKGDTGPQGPAGPAGTSGLNNLEIVTLTSASSSDGIKGVEVDCPSGKQAIGGGVTINGGSMYVALSSDAPVMSGSKSIGWYGEAREIVDYSGNWWITVHAICVTVSTG